MVGVISISSNNCLTQRLQAEAVRLGIEVRRAIIDDLSEIPGRFTTASAIFNCTGLGSLTLKGVEDHDYELLAFPSTPESDTNHYLRARSILSKRHRQVSQRCTYVQVNT
ncbi:unnamed protein product [Clonostachys chloroleuca]|uniref:Uncharacterized protein n=1 Tax=Clonostachys chloroleuca TaxID=1926264 RepID=A0AA35VB22_9HYPO|nr:unnamed protein product [Clonostachys chloroleuca]